MDQCLVRKNTTCEGKTSSGVENRVGMEEGSLMYDYMNKIWIPPTPSTISFGLKL